MKLFPIIDENGNLLKDNVLSGKEIVQNLIEKALKIVEIEVSVNKSEVTEND